MYSSITYEFQGSSSGLHAQPVILTSQATLEALDNIYQNQLPTIPCQNWTDLEKETAAACPDSIRELWEWPEHALVREDSRLSSENMAAPSRPTFEMAVHELDADAAPSPQSPTANLPTPSKIQGTDRTPSPSPPPTQTTQTIDKVRDGAEGRRAIGQALVSVRDRRPEAFREGLDAVAK